MSISATQLELAIRQGIPISAAMDFKVETLQAQQINVSGGALQNKNVHQTAFAGSLYSISTLAAWGLVFSKLPLGASLVMEKASIEYLRPVKGKILASAYLSNEDTKALLITLERDKKVRVELPVTIDYNDKRAVNFNAHLHISLNISRKEPLGK